MRAIHLFSVFILLCLASQTLLANELLFVQSLKAKLVSKPDFKAAVLASLHKGQKVKLIQRQKSWSQVVAEGKQGWVSSMLLGPKAPLKKPGLLQKINSTGPSKARRRASIQATAAATRGLRDDRNRVGTKTDTNYGAVESIEKHKVDKKDVEIFHKELLHAD